MARLLNVDRSTISREIKRGRPASKTGQYAWRKSDRMVKKRRKLANQQHRKLNQQQA